MKHWIYILYSKKANKYYVGESSNPQNRLAQHLEHRFKNNFTKIANDWTLALEKEVPSKKDALFLERFIKRMKSRRFIEKIIVSPDILIDILKNK
ncbi:GIY-YIG nuclease family protein [Sediminicola sp. 1XM1-17]|uniref:GIY-YIG nuclease family protein n=1 Tax=Sediminicola sp. 1XM1-17 TaxID=3127702 RepID=UPI003077D729